MSRPAAATCAAALSMLLLAGCTDPAPPTEPGTTTADSPASSPSASASASAEASPTPTTTRVVLAPEPPAEINDDGYEGAEAAAEYFLLLDDYIMKTNDTDVWEEMSHAECGYCSARLEQAREIAAEDHFWSNGSTSAQATHVYEQDVPTGIWPVDVELSQGAVDLKTSTGDLIYSSGPEVLDLTVEVGRQDDHWVIVGVAQPEEK